MKTVAVRVVGTPTNSGGTVTPTGLPDAVTTVLTAALAHALLQTAGWTPFTVAGE